MNTEQLQAALLDCDNALTEKRGEKPYLCASVELSSCGEKPWNACLYTTEGMRERLDGRAATPEAAIASLRAIIAALPDAETQALHDFQRDLGHLIDKGRKLGVSVDYVNPLTDLAKRLAENALTDQRERVPA